MKSKVRLNLKYRAANVNLNHFLGNLFFIIFKWVKRIQYFIRYIAYIYNLNFINTHMNVLFLATSAMEYRRCHTMHGTGRRAPNARKNGAVLPNASSSSLETHTRIRNG